MAKPDRPSLPHLPISCHICSREGGNPQIITIDMSGIFTPIPHATVAIKTLIVRHVNSVAKKGNTTANAMTVNT
jgi:hypothetical protein